MKWEVPRWQKQRFGSQLYLNDDDEGDGLVVLATPSATAFVLKQIKPRQLRRGRNQEEEQFA